MIAHNTDTAIVVTSSMILFALHGVAGTIFGAIVAVDGINTEYGIIADTLYMDAVLLISATGTFQSRTTYWDCSTS